MSDEQSVPALSVPTVCVVTALPLEARSVFEAWMLRRVQGSPFAVYEGELPGPRVPVLLVVAGVGRVAAGSGVSWLGAQVASRCALPGPSVWINYGVGGASSIGGQEARVGQTVLAAKVVDEERRRAVAQPTLESLPVEPAALAHPLAKVMTRVPTWFPPWLVGQPKKGSGLATTQRTTVYTVDRPESLCPEEGVYEMEAAGFMETALRFSTAELVQVLKVVSDTPVQGVAALDRTTVRRCADLGIPPLTELALGLVDLAQALPPPAAANLDRDYPVELRLSVTESHQWHRLVERLAALRGEEEVETVLEHVLQGHPRRPVVALEAFVDAIALEEK